MNYFLASFHAVKYLRERKKLWRYVAIPLGITVVVTGLSANFLFGWLQDVITSFLTGNSFFWYLILFVATLALVIVSFYFFIIFLNLIAGPFNDLLSEAVEAEVQGSAKEVPFSFKGLLKEYGRTITSEVARIVVFGVLILITFLLTTAITGPFAGIINGAVAVFFIVFEFVDYPLARHQFTFGQKMRFIIKHAKPFFMYGLGLMVFALIPVFNLLLIPAGVISATRLTLDLASKSVTR